LRIIAALEHIALCKIHADIARFYQQQYFAGDHQIENHTINRWDSNKEVTYFPYYLYSHNKLRRSLMLIGTGVFSGTRKKDLQKNNIKFRQ